MSLFGFRWHFPQSIFSDPIEQILAARGHTPQSWATLTDTPILHDPALFSQIDAAIDRLKMAQTRGERVIVFGDYDADGISGTATLLHFLQKAGISASYRIPHRVRDGYGMRINSVPEIAETGATLVITVDNGSVAFDAIDALTERGIDTIVTDHHAFQGKNPAAIATLNPKDPQSGYPFAGGSGSILAWKLALAAAPALGVDRSFVAELLAFAVIGLIADCCPLVDENRTLAIEGLKKLSETPFLGLIALKNAAGLDPTRPVSSDDIGFRLAPRINAAGRLASAYHAVALLMGKTENAALLSHLNDERKKLVETGIAEALEQLEGKPDCRLLVVKNKKWHAGVIGLIAGKLTERFGMPAIALTQTGDEFIASCRAPDRFDLFSPLAELSDHFSHFGGHRAAAGFSLPVAHFSDFEKAAHALFEPIIAANDLAPTLSIDAEIAPSTIDSTLYNAIFRLAPFGVAHREPIFALSGAVESLSPVGADGAHLRGRIGGVPFFAFGWGSHAETLRRWGTATIAGTLSSNDFRGKRTIEMRAVDARAG